MAEPLAKGERTEEMVRFYFLEIGYFVVRAVPYLYSGFPITDIDLWLYGKPSAISRERIIVDIKRRKTPQAIERIFWTKGLQMALGVDRCIVATTDSREDVRRFGRANSAIVLDGHFLKRLATSSKIEQDRLVEEDLMGLADQFGLGKLGGDWKGRYLVSKSRLLTGLNFDGCNQWLADIRYFLEQRIAGGNETALRLLYSVVSIFLVAVDFVLTSHATREHESRKKLMENGFRYGESGAEKADRIARAAMDAVADERSASALRQEMQKQLAEIRADVLAEHFARPEVTRSLFDIAREFERQAFARTLVAPRMLPTTAQGVLGLLADFHRLDRKAVLDL